MIPSALFGTQRTKKIVNVNPTVLTKRQDAKRTVITVFDYNEKTLLEDKLEKVEDSFSFLHNDRITWINIDGIVQADVEKIAVQFVNKCQSIVGRTS